MAGNACWPMLEDSVKPKIARACVREEGEKYGVYGDALLDSDDVVVHVADVVHVVEDERLLGVEAAGDDVFRVLATHSRALIQCQLLPQEFLVVCKLNHQGTVEGVLQPLREEEGNQVTQMETARRRTSTACNSMTSLPSRVQVELLSLLVRVEDQVQISTNHPLRPNGPVREEHSAAEPLVRFLSSHLLKTVNQLLSLMLTPFHSPA